MEVSPGDELESGEIVNEKVKIPPVKVSAERFNTQNLQEALQKSMEQIINATEKETVDHSMDTIKKLVEEIPYLQIPVEKEAEAATLGFSADAATAGLFPFPVKGTSVGGIQVSSLHAPYSR